MGRVSQAQAEENRRRVVETASRLFREQGTHASVADLMKAAGLTHGGFYKQFASKEALIDEATAHAFEELTRLRDAGLEQHAGQREAAQQAVIDVYLSAEHRDNVAEGCPAAALAADMARGAGERDARRGGGERDAHRVYAEGVSDFAEWLATEDQDGVTRLCTMVGALVLARATNGSPLSEEILGAARAGLAGTS
ncbi:MULTISPECIES: TetR family transcriptional regulator [unclassified Streptomyces]|uniref:TetR family transcriptional regulator n=1 Tax=unclassified Streptomyces TaxID=2593676 RepID=UPI002DDA147F|nr:MULTISPECIES: TetR family transcriptional regulator [unclassified Streptomyces]WSA94019.1 TetR/AcrR family transcriptional regulator [Streptomyces sp. NBC_01795]WSB78444.1 TetR/AcrR family transcriptional regulator [Streptomyces sp. NBC_01775]WSS42143.1 TetR/AcrR family transcriptional regulator [Streptomyces sp. NBC_01187]